MAARKPWSGGYIHTQEDGRELFIIERQRGGRRFHISTRCHSWPAALKQLERFEADPFGYEKEMIGGRAEGQPLVLDKKMSLEFRDYLLDRANPTTRQYANEMAHRLADWIKDLRGRNLRQLDLATLKAAVDSHETCRQHRIIAIKGLFKWLRTEKHLIDRRQDATLDLAVPQAVPEKHKRRKAVPVESVRAVLGHLAPAYRDCLRLLAHTGWHVTELQRFARDADHSRLVEGRGDVLAVLQVRHKTGSTTRTPLFAQDAVEAARRIRERGCMPRYFQRTVKKACALAGVDEFTPGVMRHSVATWAIEAGTPADQVAEFLGHRSKETTLKFYADVAVPTLGIRLPTI